MAKVTLLFSYAALFLLLLTGCGGGGGGNALPLPVNKAIILSASLKQGIPQTSLPIVSIQVEFVLPARATPIFDPVGAPTLYLHETGLKGLNPNGSIPAGSYDQSGTVRFILWQPKDPAIGLGTGEIARLTYETSSGTEFSPQEIQQIRQTLSYKVSGPGSIDISPQIEPSVSIVTYQKP